jgi:hypothetical protein
MKIITDLDQEILQNPDNAELYKLRGKEYALIG